MKRKTKTPKRERLPVDHYEAEHARLQTDQLTIFEVFEEDTGRVVHRTESEAVAQGFAGGWKDHHPKTTIRARLAILAPLRKGGAA